MFWRLRVAGFLALEAVPGLMILFSKVSTKLRLSGSRGLSALGL